jgi:hypothetical protein
MGEELNSLRDLLAVLRAKRSFRTEEVFQQAIDFFEALVATLENASVERKSEILLEMQEMAALLSQEVPLLYEKAGLTEEQILENAHSPESFAAEDWKLLSSMRQRLNDLAQAAAKSLSASLLDAKPSKNPSPSLKSPSPKPKKSRWMKS